MLGTKSANGLGMCGVILAEGTRLQPYFGIPGMNPFFAISELSEEVSDNELSLFEVYVSKHISHRYKSSEVQEKFWGKDVTTFFLIKRNGAWFYCRGARQPDWMPAKGLALEALFQAI